MVTFGALGETMASMTRRLAAASVIAGVAVLGAGYTTNTAPPGTGHHSPVAATMSALPKPFMIVARYSASHDEVFALATDGSIRTLHVTLPGA
jgi:hypothetical protein